MERVIKKMIEIREKRRAMGNHGGKGECTWKKTGKRGRGPHNPSCVCLCVVRSMMSVVEQSVKSCN